MRHYHPSPRLAGPPQVDRNSMMSATSSGGSSTLLMDSASAQQQRHYQKNSAGGNGSTSSTSGQQNLRKFTSAVGKPGQARETREAISKVLSAVNPSRSAPLAEPMDYESFVTEKSAQLEHDKDRDLLLFLRDDISGVEIWPRERTAVPSVKQRDIDEAQWLLARDALQHYSAPYTIINFNYARLGGHFKKFDSPQGLNYLRFESDLIMDEEKLMLTGQSSSTTPTDVLKEGNLIVVPGDGLVDTFRSEKKRYCMLRRSPDDGRVYIEVFKQASAAQQQQMQQPAMEMEIKSASFKSTNKKGKLLQLFPPESDKRALLLSAESEAELQFWLFEIDRALTWNNKEMFASEDTVSLGSTGRENSLPPGSSPLHDSESLASEDSGGSRDSTSAFWRSRNAAAKALQPPIVERRNLFQLYWDMEPLPEPEGEKCTLGEPLSEAEQCNAERTVPIPSSAPIGQQRGKRMAPMAPNANLDERDHSESPEPSVADFVGEKPAILFTAQIRQLEVRVRLAGREQPEQIEPFFVRLFLFDSSLGIRISEEFHMEFMHNATKHEWQNGGSHPLSPTISSPSSASISSNISTGRSAPLRPNERVNGISRALIRSARKLICAIRNPRPELFLVALIERILSDVPAEIYMKQNNTTMDSKSSAKIQKSLGTSFQRLGHLRSLFAWTARPVFPSLCPNGVFSSQQQNINTNAINTIENGGINTSRSTVASCSLYKCESSLTDADLQKLLGDMQRGEKAANKLIAFPGSALTLETDVTSVLCEFPMRISPSFLPLRPWKSAVTSTDKPPLAPSFELQSFLDQALNSEPNRGRVNLLYVFPLSLNYSTQKSFSRARNIACTVRYIPSSNRPHRSASIFHRTHPKGPFVDSFACAVQYHEQHPQFNTEVKLELPSALDEKDHLLFTFQHISVASALVNKPSGEHFETTVGYAWLPLVKSNPQGVAYLTMSEKSEEFELPVAVHLPSNYSELKLTTSNGGKEIISSHPDIKFVENGRPLFRVRLRLVSSVFSTEQRLQIFFQLCQQFYFGTTETSSSEIKSNSSNSRSYTLDQPSGCSASDIQDMTISPMHSAIEHQLIEAIEKLPSVDLDHLIPFFEVLLNRLFSLLTISKSESISIASLSAIVTLVDQLFVHRKSKRDILRTYVRLHFREHQQTPGDGGEKEETTHWAICKFIPMMIHKAQHTNDPSGAVIQFRLLRQLWFLLDCSAKSMTHWLILNNLLKAPRRGRFPSEMYFCLEELFQTIIAQIIAGHKEANKEKECRTANVALGHFLRYCLSLMDRFQILKELYSIVKAMDSVESRSFRIYKFELLQLLVGHEHWIPLCLPLLTDKSFVVMRGDNSRCEGLSTTTQNQQQNTKNSGGGSFLAKLFSQIFSPFHGIISESSEVEKFSAYSDHFHLTPTYFAVHFPIALLFQELIASLRDSREHRRRVIRLLRNLLAKHSRDERYGDTSARNRIAVLNIPLLRFAIENIRELEIAVKSVSADSSSTSPVPQGPFSRGDTYRSRSSMMTVTIDTERSSVVSGGATNSIPPSSRLSTMTLTEMNNNTNINDTRDGHNNNQAVLVILAEKLDKSEVRDLILSALYILNGLPKKILAAFWNVQESIQPALTNCQTNEPANQQPQQPQNILQDFVRLLELSLLLFHYRGRSNHIILQAKRMRSSGRIPTSMHYPKSSSDTTSSFGIGMTSQFSTLTDFTSDLHSTKCLSMIDEDGGKRAEGATSFLMDCNLAQEVALIVLDSVQTISNQIAAKTRYSSSDSYDTVFVRLLNLELELLSDWWPEAVRLHSLAALAVFINLFSARFFHSGPLDCLSTLIKALLLQLNSRIVRVQNAAAALLHLILRSGYDAALTNNSKYPADFSSSADGSKPFLTERLGRPGAQISPVLARLLSEKAILLDNFRFERGLTALESLVGGQGGNKSGVTCANSSASPSIVLTSLFDRAVLELVKQLRGVLEATQAISDTINDPIQLADLHIQLANSYRGSAALRAEFFDTLAAQHLTGTWYSEAAVCQAHTLVIIGKELQTRGLLECPDWTLLRVLNERITVEEGVNDNSFGSTQQGGFTLSDFTRKVEQLVRTLLLAERYEAVGPICRLVIPIFEHTYDFKALVGIYAEIQQACSRAAEVKASGKRHLGSYFKVTFHGQAHFGAEHRTDWIYREPKLTSLAEACDRMIESARLALGHDRVQILSERMEPNDPMMAFIQVAHVEPKRNSKNQTTNGIVKKRKWEKGQNDGLVMNNGTEEHGQQEDEQDPMGYDLHTNVRTFIQEERLRDPKVPEEASELARTALRRMTLTVENPFPDTRRRQRVVRTEETVLNPLELACESLHLKATQIRQILSAADIPIRHHHFHHTTYDKSALKKLDLKKLQLFLQGSVSPSVNAGLLAYAETFTTSAQQERYGKEGIQRLMIALKTLIAELSVALRVNEAAMGGERAEYQQMLRQSFDGMLERLPTFFGGEKFLPEPTHESKGAVGVVGSQLMNGVLGRLSGTAAAEMHIFDSISGLNG